MKILNLIILAVHLLTGGCLSLNAQNSIVKYTKRNISSSYLNIENLNTYRSRYNSLLVGAFDLTDVLPKGYRTDGSVDYTKFVQQGMDTHDKVVFPDFPILINDNGLSVSSNSTILFPDASKLILKPSKKGRYELIRIHNIKNVEIMFPKIDGNRDKHLGRDGEWGVGISIYSSSNIKLYNPTVENCWGDGITISKLASGQPSRDIKILNPHINHSRRNGISIASAVNLEIIKPVISNTYGIPPMAAIDIEPGSQLHVLDNIKIESPVTINSRYGIILALTRASGRNAKPINIAINNHVDDNSTIGFRVARFKPIYKQNPALAGEIVVTNPTWKNSKMKNLQIEETFNLTPSIIFKGGDANFANKRGNKISNQ